MENNLVSVVVITYNSEIYIQETLESIKYQTYNNIELIISDDGSIDNTLEVCNSWLAKNQNRFKSVTLLKVDKNTGVSANMNRAIQSTKGEWYKCIGGDDILLPNCIQDFMDYVKNNPDSSWIFAKAKFYNDEFAQERYDEWASTNIFKDTYKNLFTKPNAFLLKLFAKQRYTFSCSPSIFCKKQTYLMVCGYDEEFTLCEDYPMHMKLLENDFRFSFLDEYVVGYRRNTRSITSTTSSSLFNMRYVKCKFDIERKYCFKYLNTFEVARRKAEYRIHKFMDTHGLNKRNKISILLYKALLKLTL